MSQVTIARSDFYSLSQAGAILGVDRRKVSGIALALKINFKSDPTRAGKMVDRRDMRRIASALGKTVDWEAISA